jgi:hypothetical protein
MFLSVKHLLDVERKSTHFHDPIDLFGRDVPDILPKAVGRHDEFKYAHRKGRYQGCNREYVVERKCAAGGETPNEYSDDGKSARDTANDGCDMGNVADRRSTHCLCDILRSCQFCR